MVKSLEASISMYNKRMDESDVSASVASDYIPYFSLTLDHLVSTSIDSQFANIPEVHRPPYNFICNPPHYNLVKLYSLEGQLKFILKGLHCNMFYISYINLLG